MRKRKSTMPELTNSTKIRNSFRRNTSINQKPITIDEVSINGFDIDLDLGSELDLDIDLKSIGKDQKKNGRESRITLGDMIENNKQEEDIP